MIVSPKIDALVRKLRDAEHGGQYFSSDDVAGMIRELRTIRQGVTSLEDQATTRVRPTPRPAPMPLGTFYFQPAGQA